MSEDKVVLPMEKRKVLTKVPKTLLIYSLPKVGKTTIVSQLENSLLLECELGGADFVEGQILDIRGPKQLEETFSAIREANYPYKYLIIDTLTKLDEWAEMVGTYNYMNRAQGKRFNREDNISDGKMIPYADKRFTSVHELPNGNGYQYSRIQMLQWYDAILRLAPHIIFLAHVKDKFIESAKTREVVESIEISLTGKLKSIIASRVDAVGYLFRKDEQGILNFNNESNIICGGRCFHLSDEIVISERQSDKSVITYWDRIYNV